MGIVQHVDVSSDMAEAIRAGIFSATAYAIFGIWGWIPFLAFWVFVIFWRYAPRSTWWHERFGWDTGDLILGWIHWLSIPFSVIVLFLRFGEEGAVGALIAWMAWWFIRM